MKPVSRSLPTIATALNRLMVAIEPLSKYLNGCCGGLALAAGRRSPWRRTSRPGSRPGRRPAGCRGRSCRRRRTPRGSPGSVRSGLTRDPAGPVERRAGLLGQGPAERAGLDAGGPDLGDRRRSARSRPSLYFTSMPRSSTSVTIAPSITSTPSFSSSVLVAGAELGAERRQHLRRGVDQDDPRGAGVDRPEVALAGCGGRARRSGRPSRRRSGRRRRRRRSAGGRRSRRGWRRARPSRRRRRSGRAARGRRRCSSCPGANSAKWSLPK